ncbi:retrotransposon protein, putative, ty1-copia subclass [Tanacetum coccineum]
MCETHVDLQSQGNYTLFRETTKQYDAHTEIACLMLGSMTPELHRQFELYYPYDMIQELRSMFEKQAGVEKFDLIQSFHACKQEEGKPVADYVLKMKGYVEKLERPGYVLPQDITVGLILNGLTKDFAGFVSNYKMHNMGKTIGEIHAMLMEYEKSLPKKAETPQVMMIKKGKIQKANKKSLKVKGKVIGKGKDKKVYVPKPTNPKPIAKERPAKDDDCHHCKEVGHWKRNCPVYLAELIKKKKQVGTASSSDVFIIELFPFPTKSWVYDTICESATRILNMVPTKKVDKTPYEMWDGKCIFIGYPKEMMGYYFYFPPENKIVVASNIPQEVEGFGPPPQEEEISIRRSERTRQVPNRLCLNVEVEEHSPGDLNEPTSYKAAMLDAESNKWIDAMNAEIQSMMDNKVWVLVDLPPGCKTVGSKWLFKKKTDMDGIIHVYKARLVAKRVILILYGVDYKKLLPSQTIRAIRILISRAAYYDYEINANGCKNSLLKMVILMKIFM